MTRAEEVAWAAGLFEGEGSIFIHRDTIRMQLGTCDLDVLERFHRIMGCGRIFGPEVRRPPHRPLWRWIVAKQSEIPQASALLEPFWENAGATLLSAHGTTTRRALRYPARQL